ncbi:MAG: hypothetical protein NTZ13_01220 [Candidatus Parcubacteria bacterium]|nr:hypothetical protein [Candidatus Parcubacteria bacterium]
MASENNNTPKKFSWGIVIYFVAALIVLCLLYPNNSGNLVGLSGIFFSFFIALGIIVGLFAFFWWKTKKKITVDSGKKETKVSSTPKKITFWTDWKTYLMFFLGYVLWGIGQAVCITKGGPFHPVITSLPDGMFYFPYTGIFYAVLLSTFFILAIRSLNGFTSLFGVVFGGICVIISIIGFWFAPYNIAHMVYIPILRHVGLSGILFPADPIISGKWVFLGIVLAYIAAKSLPKKPLDSDIMTVIVIVIATAIFLPQLFL